MWNYFEHLSYWPLLCSYEASVCENDFFVEQHYLLEMLAAQFLIQKIALHYVCL